MSAVLAHENMPRRPLSTSPVGLGLDSDSARWSMAETLERRGIKDPSVLDAMATVPRHLFVDPAIASRAYEDVALPIGLEQTISKPSIVARMVEIAARPVPFAERRAARVLEIGSGCGYQAAILAQVFGEVVSVERLRPLHQLAKSNLKLVPSKNIRLVFGDGHLGLVNSPPFHAIVVAAAIDGEIPEVLLHLIRVGGRLIAPVSQHGRQRLCLVERFSFTDWHLSELDAVRFVPMLGGTR
ncbi:MAG: protein-L-isoaspartate(D-aspartate) O-methyltransferase [Burkholderiaceae bacterium]